LLFAARKTMPSLLITLLLLSPHATCSGHTQTTLERKAKHRELFGTKDNSSTTTSGTVNPSDPLSDPMFDRLPPAVRKALQEAQQMGVKSTPAQRMDLVPKSCPHCE
jgi:hypothetical protein